MMKVHLDELDLVFQKDGEVQIVARPLAATNRTLHFKVWDGYSSILETDCPTTLRMPHYTSEIVVELRYQADILFIQTYLGYSLTIGCNPHPGVDLTAPEAGNIWMPILKEEETIDWSIKVPRRVAVQLTEPLYSAVALNGFHYIQVSKDRHGALAAEVAARQEVFFVPPHLNMLPGTWMILEFNGGRQGPRFDYVAHSLPE
jgi:hypothetical protein